VTEPKRRSTNRSVLSIVGIVLLVCFGGLLVGGFYLITSVRNATVPVRDAGEAFAGDLEAGNLDGAYGRLCRATRGDYSREEFAAVERAQPALTGHRILGVTVSTVNGRRTGQVIAELTRANGSVERHSFLLVEEDGTWKVCGSPY
jgi:hypothetical protein